MEEERPLLEYLEIDRYSSKTSEMLVIGALTTIPILPILTSSALHLGHGFNCKCRTIENKVVLEYLRYTIEQCSPTTLHQKLDSIHKINFNLATHVIEIENKKPKFHFWQQHRFYTHILNLILHCAVTMEILISCFNGLHCTSLKNVSSEDGNIRTSGLQKKYFYLPDNNYNRLVSHTIVISQKNI